VIDYNAVAFEEVASEIDVVLDTMGEEILARSVKTLSANGRIISIVDWDGADKLADQGIDAKAFLVTANQAQLQEITTLIDAGKIMPTIAQVLPLDEIQQAHKLIETHHTRGKIVLKVD